MRTFEIKRFFKASPEQLFDAWTTPQMLHKWWCTPGYRFEQLDIDLQPKGTYRYLLVPEEGVSGPVCTMEGRFYKVRYPHELAYSWTIRAGDFEECDTTVQVTFVQKGDQTRLSLLHDGFITEEGYNLHALDWAMVLEKLDKVLTEESMLVQ